MRHVRANPLITLALTVLLFLCAGLGTRAARADTIVGDISDYLVSITSNFSGAQIFAFGTIDVSSEDEDPLALAFADVVVVLQGPPKDITVRKKGRVAGVWMNTDEIEFANVPSFVYIASTRPLSEIAGGQMLKRHQIGLEHLQAEALLADEQTSTPPVGSLPGVGVERGSSASVTRNNLFRRALIWEKSRAGLYIEDPEGVIIRNGRLFRAQINLPAQVPVGAYTVQFYLVREGTVTDSQKMPLYVERSDIEHLIYRFAHEWPFFYGVFSVVVACLAGFGASALFGRK